MSFKNKVAIVTGAGQGIGFEIGRNLAREGANVILNDVDTKKPAEIASDWRAIPAICYLFKKWWIPPWSGSANWISSLQMQVLR